SSTSPARSFANDGSHRPAGTAGHHVGPATAAIVAHVIADRVRCPAAARPGRVEEALARVHPADGDPAVPALLRLPLRVPDDRAGGWRWAWRSGGVGFRD